MIMRQLKENKSKENKEPVKNKALLYALRVIGIRMHSEAELTKKMVLKKHTSADIKETLDVLKKNRLINDVRFIEVYVEELRDKGVGNLQIVNKLKQRGITTTQIEENFEPENSTSQMERAMELAQSRMPSNGEFDNKVKNRIYNFLARKGFDFEICRTIVEKMDSNSSIDW